VQAWKCQFEKPTIKELIGELDPETGKLYQDLRQTIVRILNKKPKLEWLGLSWCWCETTTFNDGGMLLAVYLVGDPLNPRIAIMLSTSFFETHPPRTLPKSLHTGLGVATCVGHQTWCEWSVNTQEVVDDIRKVIELAHGS